MMSLVLVIAIANLAVGYLAAAALMEPPIWAGLGLRLPRMRLPSFRRRRSSPRAEGEREPDATKQDEAPQTARDTSPIASAPAVPATIAGVDELSTEWLLQLASQGVVAESFVEGAVQVLRLEVGRYREHLVAAEERGRELALGADVNGLKLLAGDLQIINRDWLERQSAATGMLAERAGRLGDHEAVAVALEQVLLDQAAEIQATCTALETQGTLSEVDGGAKQLLEGIGALLDRAHALRDRMLDLLATLLRTGERLETMTPAGQLDPETGLPNRTGLESALMKWWRDDKERSRPLSVVLVDIDRFSRLNQRLGARLGDQTIVALSKLFHELVRSDDSADRLARISGESFVIVMGDAGPREALTAAERLRQTVEATTFDHQGAEFELTISCGVIEVARGESILDLLRRANNALRYAKKAGRNRCALDEGRGPTTLEPPQFPVKSQVVRLGDR